MEFHDGNLTVAKKHIGDMIDGAIKMDVVDDSNYLCVERVRVDDLEVLLLEILRLENILLHRPNPVG